MTDKELATESLALPKSVDGVLAIFTKLLALSEVQEIVVTPVGISVTRRVEPGVEVVPAGTSDVPVSQVLGLLDHLDSLPPSKHTNPYLRLVDACVVLRRYNAVPAMIVVFDLEEFAAFLGLEVDGLGTPPEVLGIPVHVMDAQQDEYSGKIVIFGGASKYLSDAKYGVVFDVGG